MVSGYALDSWLPILIVIMTGCSVCIDCRPLLYQFLFLGIILWPCFDVFRHGFLVDQLLVFIDSVMELNRKDLGDFLLGLEWIIGLKRQKKVIFEFRNRLQGSRFRLPLVWMSICLIMLVSVLWFKFACTSLY